MKLLKLFLKLGSLCSVILIYSCTNSGSSSQENNSQAALQASSITFSSFELKSTNGYISRGIITGLNIHVEVPYKTDVNSLIANYQVYDGSNVIVNNTLQENAKTVNNFSNPVNYLIKGINNAKATYTVNVEIAKSNQAEFSFIKINGQDVVINEEDHTIVYELPYHELNKLVNLPLDWDSSGANVKLNGVAVASPYAYDFSNGNAIINITSDDGSVSKDYTIIIKKGKSDEADFNSFSLNGHNLQINNGSIIYEVPFIENNTIPALIAKWSTSGAFVTVDGKIANSGEGTYDFSVNDGVKIFVITAEDGKTTKKYSVKTIPGKSNHAELSWLQIDNIHEWTITGLSVKGKIDVHTVDDCSAFKDIPKYNIVSGGYPDYTDATQALGLFNDLTIYDKENVYTYFSNCMGAKGYHIYCVEQ